MSENPKDTTVIVPVFGPYEKLDVLRCTIRRWRTQSIAPMITVVYQGEMSSPTIQRISVEEGAKYVFEPASRDRDGPIWTPGSIRNAGIVSARTPWLYLSDADTFPSSNRFLFEVLEYHTQSRLGMKALVHPKMIRVFDDGSFVKRMLEGNLASSHDCAADTCFYLSINGELLRLDRSEVSYGLNSGRLVCLASEIKAERRSPHSRSEIVLRPDFHFGGVFIRRQSLIDIGGYCEAYRHWGYEDNDLIFKINSTIGHQRLQLPEIRRPIVHIEHERRYLGQLLDANRSLFRKRSEVGVQYMINQDKESLFKRLRSVNHPMLKEKTFVPVKTRSLH